MNKTLRQSFKSNSWSAREGFLQYLRQENCFSHMAGKEKANPYWWGSLLDFVQLEKVVRQLFEQKSIKLGRLKGFADDCAEDYLSPTVRLTGLTLQRLVGELSKKGA